MPDGDNKIYQKRDKNFETWNRWRDFRPVVLFYGERLANNRDIDSLERFLGEEGLLRNDDMFGEGFFMGLEILVRSVQLLQGNKRLKLLLKKYELKIASMGEKEVILKISKLQEFMKSS